MSKRSNAQTFLNELTCLSVVLGSPRGVAIAVTIQPVDYLYEEIFVQNSYKFFYNRRLP